LQELSGVCLSWIRVGETLLSSIVTTEGILHYEVDGRGKPVVLLHGWLSSWGLWRNTMLTLSDERRYRIYALDFWGFGDSAKKSVQAFNVASYASMVEQFMDKMGIAKAPIIGHSMGGTVSLKLTLDCPSRVERVVIVGSPIAGNSLNIFLKLGSFRFIANLIWRAPSALMLGLKIFSPILAQDGREVYEILKRDFSQTTVEAFLRSIGSLWHTDLRPSLGQIGVDVLGVYGKSDKIVNPNQAGVLKDGVTKAHIQMMAKSGHFPMLDEPELFHNAILTFLIG
jgi:pimeloyl-ACP methyl ester carboxylesterase